MANGPTGRAVAPGQQGQLTPPVVILSSPVALVTPKLAHHLERALHDMAAKAQRDGFTLPPEVTEHLADVRRLAELYRRQVTDATDANVSRIADVPPLRRMLSTEVVGELAGITPHGVRDAARRGVIPAQRVGNRYEFDEIDVTEWLAKRQETA